MISAEDASGVPILNVSSTGNAERAALGKAGPLSIERILGILFSIASDREGKSLTDLSLELHTPKTSLLNLLPGLTAAGYLERSGRAYRLGPMAYRLATAITRSSETVVTVAQPLLRRLADDTGKTVTLCVLTPDERAILHIAKEESRAAMRFAVEVGTRAPLHTTAGGRVMLAFRPGDWVEGFFQNAQLTPQTKHSITDREQLRISVEQVRYVGYALTQGETHENVGAIAAPIFDAGNFTCALVVAGAVEQIVNHSEKIGLLVKNTANEISTLLSLAGR